MTCQTAYTDISSDVVTTMSIYFNISNLTMICFCMSNHLKVSVRALRPLSLSAARLPFQQFAQIDSIFPYVCRRRGFQNRLGTASALLRLGLSVRALQQLRIVKQNPAQSGMLRTQPVLGKPHSPLVKWLGLRRSVD